MNKLWLNRKGNKNCVLFFNGWGMDENAVKHLDFDNYDVCMFNNYSHINELEFDSENYNEIYLITWSLGVWAASQSINTQKPKYKKAIAINGTQIPKNKTYGIHPAIFENTLINWNNRNRNKFNMRSLGGKNEYVKQSHRFISRSCEDQKCELESINKQLDDKVLNQVKFDCCIVGRKDLIFLPENQINYWKQKSRFVEMDIPHYPFNAFASWNEIIGI